MSSDDYVDNSRPDRNSWKEPASFAAFFTFVIITVSLVIGMPVIVPGINALPPGSAFAGELRTENPVTSPGVPTLVDLGADRCLPCRQIKPILEELQQEYKGRFNVVIYDVLKDSAPAYKYGIYTIPTQIFLDEAGNELYRHIGYWSKREILNMWEELGYKF
jgi:thioredoxin 1